MDFNFGTKEEAIEAAKQSEYAGGNFVSDPGEYIGVVDTAVFKKFDSGAGGLEISMTVTDDGENEGKSCKVLLLTMKKDGTSTYKTQKGDEKPLSGINQIRGALMPVLMKKDLNGVESDGEIIYPDIIGQRLGMLINIRLSNGKRKDGSLDPAKVFKNADLKTFFHPVSGLCGSEILGQIKTPERKEKIMKALKVIDDTIADGAASGGAGGDLFNDGATGAGEADDPFANTDTGSGTTQDTVKKEVKKEVVEETVKEEVKKEVVDTKAEEKTKDPDDFWN